MSISWQDPTEEAALVLGVLLGRKTDRSWMRRGWGHQELRELIRRSWRARKDSQSLCPLQCEYMPHALNLGWP